MSFLWHFFFWGKKSEIIQRIRMFKFDILCRSQACSAWYMYAARKTATQNKPSRVRVTRSVTDVPAGPAVSLHLRALWVLWAGRCVPRAE